MMFRPHAPGRLLVAVASAVVAVSVAACSGAASPAPEQASPDATATPVATAPAGGTPAAVDATPGGAGGGPAVGGMLARGVYLNPAFHVQFRYPPTWAPDQGYDQRWSGPDGFVQVLAFGGAGQTVQQAADALVSHHLHPYGTQPTIEPIMIDGVEGRLILPSADQNSVVKGESAIVVAPPNAIVLDSGTYRFLQIDADAAHIRDIAASVTFLSPQAGGPQTR